MSYITYNPTGMKILKRNSAVYHIPKSKMKELFQIELFKVRIEMDNELGHKFCCMTRKKTGPLDDYNYNQEWDLRKNELTTNELDQKKAEVMKEKDEAMKKNYVLSKEKMGVAENEEMKRDEGNQGDGVKQEVASSKNGTKVINPDKTEKKKVKLEKEKLKNQKKAEKELLKEKKKIEKLEKKKTKEEKKLKAAKMKEEKKLEKKELKERKYLEKKKLKKEKK